MSEPGGVVASVAPGGLGEELGLRPGDRLLSLGGRVLRDVVDLRFYGSEELVALTVRRGSATLELQARRSYGQSWGIEFEAALFDGIRTCGNRCPFCFVAGLPPGLRPSLYVRDDDYRLSFLSGSFVTLTNLAAEDWARLAEQRLSPLYVSVQATEPDLRRRLLGGRPIPDVRQQLARLGEIGIVVHAQIVVCPGLNDGAALARTVDDLWQLRSAVQSVALVPVGLTSHHPARLQPVTPAIAAEIVAFAARWRRRAYRLSGRRFVYPSDELYLLAGVQVPGARTYDGFPQLGNGVGPVRRFLDDWARTRRRLETCGARPAVAGATLVTGQAFLPFLGPVAEAMGRALGIECRAWGIVNRTFGPGVTVAGLLAARDVTGQLAGRHLGEVVVLPRTMLDAAGERTLDDWTLPSLAHALGRRVAVAGLPNELLHILAAPPA